MQFCRCVSGHLLKHFTDKYYLSSNYIGSKLHAYIHEDIGRIPTHTMPSSTIKPVCDTERRQTDRQTDKYHLSIHSSDDCTGASDNNWKVFDVNASGLSRMW